MAEDKALKEAIEACSKIIEEKCGKRPYMVLITKADVRFESAEHKKKGIITGTASFMYTAKPRLKKDGLSKILLDTTKHALKQAEKAVIEESES
ncbi:MAG: hypothetical protein V1827_00885 [Candidatus Micrarchaeota archaeon]